MNETRLLDYDHRIVYENMNGHKDILFKIDDSLPDERYQRNDMPPMIGAEHVYKWFELTAVEGRWLLTCNTDSYYALRRLFE